MGIKVEKSMICGGGAKSPLWRKIFANVMNIVSFALNPITLCLNKLMVDG